jgi:hypothetical protein
MEDILFDPKYMMKLMAHVGGVEADQVKLLKGLVDNLRNYDAHKAVLAIRMDLERETNKESVTCRKILGRVPEVVSK